jgi:hypothetical protein
MQSHIHGTNAFMVYMGPDRNDFLGVAHFHRPNDGERYKYARFGHHYITHAFYTISATQPHFLTALSAEFVLPAYDDDDAEVIQFVSGLGMGGPVPYFSLWDQ